MNKDIENTLTQGLVTGYAGGKPDVIERGSFPGKSSHPTLPNDAIYHDEWFVLNHSGGGQELVQVGEQKFTRLYAGGTPDPKELVELGITPEDVNKYLKKKIMDLQDKTRLFENSNPDPEDKWKYLYEITGNYPETSVTTSLESITYDGQTVHIHAFILCPLK